MLDLVGNPKDRFSRHVAQIYALVIFNHGPPTPGAGRGIAVKMSGVFTFALSPQCGGNTRDLCYIGKKGGAMKT